MVTPAKRAVLEDDMRERGVWSPGFISMRTLPDAYADDPDADYAGADDYTYADAHANAQANADANAHADAPADAYAYATAYAYADADAEADADAKEQT